MKIALLILTFAVGLTGWLWPEQAPAWLTYLVLGAMTAMLAIEIYLERRDSKEAQEMHSKLVEIHSSETARPGLELTLNGVRIETREQLVPVPEGGEGPPFVLGLKNTGSATASDVQAFLWVPSDLPTLLLGKHWIHNGTPSKPGTDGTEHVAGVTEHAFLSPAAINVGNWLTLGNGKLPGLPKGTTIPMRLKVYANGGVFEEWTFGVRYESGAQQIAPPDPSPSAQSG